MLDLINHIYRASLFFTSSYFTLICAVFNKTITTIKWHYSLIRPPASTLAHSNTQWWVYILGKLGRWLYLLRGWAIKSSITTDEGYKRALKGPDTHHRNAKACIYADNEPGLIAKGILEQSMVCNFRCFDKTDLRICSLQLLLCLLYLRKCQSTQRVVCNWSRKSAIFRTRFSAKILRIYF